MTRRRKIVRWTVMVLALGLLVEAPLAAGVDANGVAAEVGGRVDPLLVVVDGLGALGLVANVAWDRLVSAMRDVLGERFGDGHSRLQFG